LRFSELQRVTNPLMFGLYTQPIQLCQQPTRLGTVLWGASRDHPQSPCVLVLVAHIKQCSYHTKESELTSPALTRCTTNEKILQQETF